MRNSVRAVLVASLATVLLAPVSANADLETERRGGGHHDRTLERYAADTWRSVRAMALFSTLGKTRTMNREVLFSASQAAVWISKEGS